MMASRLQWLPALLLVCCAQVAPTPVAGQEPPDSVVAIDPVVVRVLRSAVGMGSPYAISTVSGDELTRGSAGTYLEEALRALPGVQIQNRFNLASGERIAIRGFGSRAQFGIRGVRVLVDGIPATLPDGQTALDHLDVSSLERVTLLRGPGSSLYGNAAGGVLDFRSRAPSATTRASFRSAGGSDGLMNLGADLSGPAGGGGYRLSASRYGYDGFRRNPVADDGSTYGRQERTIANAVFDMPLATGKLRVVANALDMAAANAGSISQALLDEGGKQAYRFGVLQGTREDVQQGQLGATWTGTLGSLDGEIAAWGIRRDFEGRIPPSVVGFDRNAGGMRAIVSGSRPTGGGRLSLGGGVEVEFQRDERRNWENERSEKGALTLEQDERVRGTGLFAQARLEPNATLAVLAGIRFDAFRFSADDRFLADGSDDSGSQVMRAVSPSLGLVANVGDGVEVFGSLSTSFETPTTTELANRPDGAGGFNPDLDPTRALTVEGGLRARVGEVWSVEAVVFRNDVRNELIPFEVPSAAGRTFFRNAGASSHQGWEVTAEGRPLSALWVRLAYTGIDARFDSFALEDEDFSGNRIPGLSPHRFDGRVVLDGRGGFVELRGLYQDAIPVNDGNTAESPSALVADVRVGLQRFRAGGVAISPFLAVANVLDRSYNASVVVNAFGGRFFEPGPGRTFQAGLGITFGG